MQLRSPREAYGEALVELGEQNPDVVVLDADVAPSTGTIMFAQKFPQRFICVGIAEQNLVGIAAGLALSGKIPYVSSFAVFVPGKCLDQLRNMVAHPCLNVKIVSSHAGLATGEDGATHQAIEDLAVMRAVPNFKVIVPGDAVATKQFTHLISRINSPVYMRLFRPATPLIYPSDQEFELGKAIVLQDGADVAIFGCGIGLIQALEAAQRLARDGISAAVIDLHTLKPLDEACVLKYAHLTGRLISVEDHNVIGGLGSAIAEVLCEKHPAKLIRIGVQDRFGESGPYDQLLVRYGISPQNIVSKAHELLKLV